MRSWFPFVLGVVLVALLIGPVSLGARQAQSLGNINQTQIARGDGLCIQVAAQSQAEAQALAWTVADNGAAPVAWPVAACTSTATAGIFQVRFTMNTLPASAKLPGNHVIALVSNAPGGAIVLWDGTPHVVSPSDPALYSYTIPGNKAPGGGRGKFEV